MFAQEHALTFRRAREMGINKRAAASMRRRFLEPRLAALILDGSPVALFWAKEIIDELHYLEKHEGYEFAERRGENRITDEMVERARSAPVTEVVQFDRSGRTYAWCHQDKKPSLTYMSRKKLAWCPACGRYFSALDVLIERDGKTFSEAVRELAA